MKTKYKSALRASLLAGFAGLAVPALSEADALHGFCDPSSVCAAATAGGVPVISVSSNTPTYGFWDAGGPKTGQLWIITLIPDTLSGAGSEVFSVSGHLAHFQGDWVISQLDSFLSISASPANPIGAFPASGYDVYRSIMGSQTLAGATGSGPTFDDGAFSIPTGSSIVAFLGVPAQTGGTDWIATANSSQLYIGGGNHAGVPEPATLGLFGLGLAGIGFARRRKAA